MNNWKLIKQINKLKKMCNCPTFFAGSEMYRLLHYDVLQSLVSQIEPIPTKLASTLLFGKKVISAEEQFLYILNKYIVFIKNQCFINTNELVIIIEETLKSDYSRILFSHLDYNENENPLIFHNEFKKMFLDILFKNFKKYFCMKNPNHTLSKLKVFSLDDNEQLNTLFIIFRGIINSKRNNLYIFFAEETLEMKKDRERQMLCYNKWSILINDYMNVKIHLDIIGL